MCIRDSVGVDQVIALGDAHVSVAASQLLGGTFAKLIVVFVIVSVMGTVKMCIRDRLLRMMSQDHQQE